LLFDELKVVMGPEVVRKGWSKLKTLNEALLIIKNLVLQEANLELTTEILIYENFRLQRRLELMKKTIEAPSNSPDS
jgi:hypothetical protein